MSVEVNEQTKKKNIIIELIFNVSILKPEFQLKD